MGSRLRGRVVRAQKGPKWAFVMISQARPRRVMVGDCVFTSYSITRFCHIFLAKTLLQISDLAHTDSDW